MNDTSINPASASAVALAGVGGLYWNIAKEQLKNVPPGGSVWTFAVMPD